MKRSIAVLLLLIPLFDVVVLVVVGRAIGAPATVALVVLTALVGLMLARFEGRRNLRRIERNLRLGEVPTDNVLEGALILAAGLLLLTPGLVTDALGLLALFGPTRRLIRIGLKRYVILPYLDSRSDGLFTGRVYVGGFSGTEPDDPVDIDIEVEDVEDGAESQGKP
ncbi:MAG: FxsA family protein [Halobacteriota archaeon]